MTHLELITQMVERAEHHPRGDELRRLADKLDRRVAGRIPPTTVTAAEVAEARREAEDLWKSTLS